MNANVDNKTRKAVYKRDGYQCALCDYSRHLQIHHVVRRGEGGPNIAANMIALCADCHALAHGIDLRGFGADPEDVRHAIVEYMADLYANAGYLWSPWGCVPLTEDQAVHARFAPTGEPLD